MRIERGKVYWKVNGGTNTFDTLDTTLESFGLVKVGERTLGGEYGFKRVRDWKTRSGISFSTIWYVNFCNIRFGDYDIDIAEITFDTIQGSCLPYADHHTVDFYYRGNRVFTLALRKENDNA